MNNKEERVKLEKEICQLKLLSSLGKKVHEEEADEKYIKLIQLISNDISSAISPIGKESAPLIIAVLEIYADVLKSQDSETAIISQGLKEIIASSMRAAFFPADLSTQKE